MVLLVARVIVAGVDEPALVRGLVPQPLDGSAALLAVGFIGATVMPHALHFHSAVAREDSRPKDAAKLAAAARSKRAIAIATSCAAVASVSLVLIAARLPTEASGGLTEAYAAIGDVLGQIAAVGAAGAAGVRLVVDNRRHLYRPGRHAGVLAATDRLVAAAGCSRSSHRWSS